MNTGTLYVVATPIGNLDDISVRAVSILRAVDLVAAEDTRTARVLMDRHEIDTQTRSFHDHNEESIAPVLLHKLESGLDIALISEAGTPGVSDPGFHLVREAHRREIEVIAIPGPCAAVAALSASGLPSDRFYFLGFLPRGRAAREQLQEAGLVDASLIIYESPERIAATLSLLDEVLGQRTVALAREMTKIHEEHFVGTLDYLLQLMQEDELPARGEFTLVVAPAGFSVDGEFPSEHESPEAANQVVMQQVHLLVQSGYRLSRAARIVARGHELPRSDVYRCYLHHYRSSD